MSDQQYSLLKAKRLIDGSGAPARKDMSVLIADGVIREIGHQDEIVAPPRTEVIDLGDRTIMPGIVDAHMHFFGLGTDRPFGGLPADTEVYRALRVAGEARRMLEAGITAVRCLGSGHIGPSLRKAINDGHVPGPRMVAAGHFISSTAGTFDHLSVPLEWVKADDLLADGVDGVREMVRRRIRQGADVIKVGLSRSGVIGDNYQAWGEDPYNQIASYSMEEMQALAQEAHRNKLKVSAHCIGDDAVRLALETNVDTIEHGYGITDETRRMLVDKNVMVVSTICQLYFHVQGAETFDYPDWARKLFQRHIEAMQSDFEKNLIAGVRYALGTDLIGYPTHPQELAAKEFELAVAWGMDPMQAIVAGTKISAEAMSMDHVIGTIATGKWADVIAFSGDPLREIAVLQRVEFVMQGGKIIVDKRTPGSQ